jgi:hypothetical protein
VTVGYRLVGRVTAGPEYRLRYIGQPLVNDGELSVTLDPLKGEIVSMSVTRGGGPGGSRNGFVFRSSLSADTVVAWRAEDSS